MDALFDFGLSNGGDNVLLVCSERKEIGLRTTMDEPISMPDKPALPEAAPV